VAIGGICESHLPGRRVVTDADWRRAHSRLLEVIENDLRETVRAAAEQNDNEQMVSKLRQEQRLGDGRLWDAFTELARRHPPKRHSVAR